MGNGNVKYLVEWPNNAYKIIDSEEARRMCPMLVVQFLESHIVVSQSNTYSGNELHCGKCDIMISVRQLILKLILYSCSAKAHK